MRRTWTVLHEDGYDSAHTFFGVPVLPAGDAESYRLALDEAFSAGKHLHFRQMLGDLIRTASQRRTIGAMRAP
jgi:hypothetical protein